MTTSRERDQIAADGPMPWRRIAPPEADERCPRCHRRKSQGRQACMLCAPDLVPAANFGPCEICERPTGFACVDVNGMVTPKTHPQREDAKARMLIDHDLHVHGIAYERVRRDGRVEHIPAAEVLVHRRSPR